MDIRPGMTVGPRIDEIIRNEGLFRVPLVAG
jgi:hypothetical protein